jgi:hypothetical protein
LAINQVVVEGQITNLQEQMSQIRNEDDNYNWNYKLIRTEIVPKVYPTGISAWGYSATVFHWWETFVTDLYKVAVSKPVKPPLKPPVTIKNPPPG